MTSLNLRVLIGACAGILLTAPVHADILGSIWEGVSNANNATPANVPGTTPNVTFDVPGNSLNFDSRVGGYTIGGFLSSGGATITSGSGDAGNTVNNTMFNITGMVSVTTGQTFTVTHDDGLTFIIGTDTVINHPSATAPTTTTETYTGPSGTFDFQLVYGECCGAPAVLQMSGLNLVSTPVPEPGSIALLSSVLLVLGFALRKRFAKVI